MNRCNNCIHQNVCNKKSINAECNDFLRKPVYNIGDEIDVKFSIFRIDRIVFTERDIFYEQMYPYNILRENNLVRADIRNSK